jgi:transmembrane sensor
VVAAGSGTARALGTRFAVRREDGSVEVTVLEHQVAVSATTGGSKDSEPVVLSPGQRVRYDAAHGVGPVDSIDIGRATAWQRGRLVFDKVPLSTAIAEINRYRRARIAILDGALARREVSGVFRLDDLDGAVDTIAAELGARTASLPPFVTLLF